MEDRKLDQLIINKLSAEQHQKLVENNEIVEDEIYLVPSIEEELQTDVENLKEQQSSIDANLSEINQKIQNNTVKIEENSTAIGANAQKIEENSAAIEENVSQISQHKEEVSEKLSLVDQSLEAQSNEIETVKGDLTSHATSSNSQFALVREEFAAQDTETLKTAKEYSDANKESAVSSANEYTDQKIDELVNGTGLEGVVDTIKDINEAMAESSDMLEALETANSKKVDKGAKGSTIKPIYFDENGAQEIAYTIEKSVPADAKFTDTTYTLIKDATNKKIQLMNGETLVSEVDDNNTTYTIDGSLSTSSTNPIQNKVVAENINNLQEDIDANASEIEEIKSKDLFETKHEEGNTIAVSDSAETPFVSMKLYGKTTQDGTPTPDNPIELKSVGDSGSFETWVCGKNVFDGIFEQGHAQHNNAAPTRVRIKNLIPISKGKKYTITKYNDTDNTFIFCVFSNITPKSYPLGHQCGTVNEWCYNSSYSFVATNDGVLGFMVKRVDEIVLSPTDLQDVKFQVEIGDSTEYEPCNKQGLTMPYELRSVDDIKDEVDFTKGSRTENTYKKVFTGTESFNLRTDTSGGGYYFEHRDYTVKASKNDYDQNTVCNRLPVIPELWGRNITGYMIASDKSVRLRVDGCTTVAQLQAKLKEWYDEGNPLTIITERATPTETQLTEEELNDYRQLHTNKPNTTILSEADMEVDYVVDSTSAEYIENRLDTLETGLNNAINGIEIGGRNLLLNTSEDYVVGATNNTQNYVYREVYSGLQVGETYTFSAEVTVEGTTNKSVSVTVYNLNTNTSGGSVVIPADGTRQSVTFTVTNNTPHLLLYAGVAGATAGIKATYHHMKLEKGNKDTDWTPALEDTQAQIDDKLSFDEEVVNSTSDVGKVVPEGSGKYAAINKVGGMSYKCKNLYENRATTFTNKGITWTVNEDGSVTANGTSTEIAQLNLGTMKLPRGNYKATGYNGNVDGVYLYIKASTDTGWPFVAGERDVTYTEDVNVYFLISINAGVTVNNLKFYPMLRKATETSATYEPYYNGIRNAAVTSIKSVGKNLLNEAVFANTSGSNYTEFVDGQIHLVNTTGTAYTSNAILIPLQKGNYYLNMESNSYTGGFSVAIVWDGTKTQYLNGVSSKKLYFNVTSPIALSVRLTTDNTNKIGDSYANMWLTTLSNGEYTPYKENTLVIPEAIGELEGYGLGINENCYNYIDWERKVFVKRCVKVFGFTKAHSHSTVSAWSTPRPAEVDNTTSVGLCSVDVLYNPSDADTPHWYKGGGSIWIYAPIGVDVSDAEVIVPLTIPEEIDISAYLPDNFIEVAESGVITAVNEYNYNAPTEISFFTGESPEKVIVADKIVGDLVGVATGANAYSLPTASSSELGGVKTGYTANGKNYPVALDANGKMYVNVPWTDSNTDTRVVASLSTATLTSSQPLVFRSSAYASGVASELLYVDTNKVSIDPYNGYLRAKKFIGNLSGTASEAENSNTAKILKPQRCIFPAAQYMDTLGQGIFYISDKDGYNGGRYYYVGIALGFFNEDNGEYFPVFKPNPISTTMLTKIYNAFADYASGSLSTSIMPYISVPNGEIYFRSTMGQANIQSTLQELISLVSLSSGVSYNTVSNCALVYVGDMLLYGAIVHFDAPTDEDRDAIDDALDTINSLYVNKEIEATFPLDIGSTTSMSFNSDIDLGF